MLFKNFDYVSKLLNKADYEDYDIEDFEDLEDFDRKVVYSDEELELLNNCHVSKYFNKDFSYCSFYKEHGYQRRYHNNDEWSKFCEAKRAHNVQRSFRFLIECLKKDSNNEKVKENLDRMIGILVDNIKELSSNDISKMDSFSLNMLAFILNDLHSIGINILDYVNNDSYAIYTLFSLMNESWDIREYYDFKSDVKDYLNKNNLSIKDVSDPLFSFVTDSTNDSNTKIRSNSNIYDFILAFYKNDSNDITQSDFLLLIDLFQDDERYLDLIDEYDGLYITDIKSLIKELKNKNKKFISNSMARLTNSVKKHLKKDNTHENVNELLNDFLGLLDDSHDKKEIIISNLLENYKEYFDKAIDNGETVDFDIFFKLYDKLTDEEKFKYIIYSNYVPKNNLLAFFIEFLGKYNMSHNQNANIEDFINLRKALYDKRKIDSKDYKAPVNNVNILSCMSFFTGPATNKIESEKLFVEIKNKGKYTLFYSIELGAYYIVNNYLEHDDFFNRIIHLSANDLNEVVLNENYHPLEYIEANSKVFSKKDEKVRALKEGLPDIALLPKKDLERVRIELYSELSKYGFESDIVDACIEASLKLKRRVDGWASYNMYDYYKMCTDAICKASSNKRDELKDINYTVDNERLTIIGDNGEVVFDDVVTTIKYDDEENTVFYELTDKDGNKVFITKNIFRKFTDYVSEFIRYTKYLKPKYADEIIDNKVKEIQRIDTSSKELLDKLDNYENPLGYSNSVLEFEDDVVPAITYHDKDNDYVFGNVSNLFGRNTYIADKIDDETSLISKYRQLVSSVLSYYKDIEIEKGKAKEKVKNN